MQPCLRTLCSLLHVLPHAYLQWDLPLLLSRCDALYETLDPSIRLIPSRPQNLLQRKKTLACNLAFSVCPYIDVNGKKERFEFNRLFGAARNGPDRLTEQFVPDSVKAHVQVRKTWPRMRMPGASLGRCVSQFLPVLPSAHTLALRLCSLSLSLNPALCRR